MLGNRALPGNAAVAVLAKYFEGVRIDAIFPVGLNEREHKGELAACGAGVLIGKRVDERIASGALSQNGEDLFHLKG